MFRAAWRKVQSLRPLRVVECVCLCKRVNDRTSPRELHASSSTCRLHKTAQDSNGAIKGAIHVRGAQLMWVRYTTLPIVYLHFKRNIMLTTRLLFFWRPSPGSNACYYNGIHPAQHRCQNAFFLKVQHFPHSQQYTNVKASSWTIWLILCVLECIFTASTRTCFTRAGLSTTPWQSGTRNRKNGRLASRCKKHHKSHKEWIPGVWQRLQKSRI